MSGKTYTALSGGEEEGELPYSNQSHVLISRKERQVLWASIVTLTIALAVSLSIGLFRGQYSSASENELALENSLLEPQDFFPRIGHHSVIFEGDKHYEDTGALGDRVWTDLIPAGEGYVRIPHPRRFNIQQSSPVPDDAESAEYYMVSVVHQLHCLGIVRNALISVRNGSSSAALKDPHTYHCLDYIRQGIMCAGDTTLEWARAELDKEGQFKRWFFDGSGSTHICRNYGTIKDFLESHQ